MRRFEDEMEQLTRDPQVLQMEQYQQHRNTTTYHHCCRVSRMAYRIAQGLRIEVDEAALARGAMLHDFYLYATEGEAAEGNLLLREWLHGYRHAQCALDNAARLYELSEKERNIIYSHMWPLNLTHLPRSREAVLVCIADKLCAAREMAAIRRRQ